MAAPTKPLFNPHLLARRAAALHTDLNDAQRAILNKWTAAVAAPSFLRENEKPHQGQFLADLFSTVLGYRQFADDPTDYHLKAEAASTETSGGKTPDARLGWYGSTSSRRTRVVVELKAPGADLDARQRRAGSLTPVEQAFGYVPKFDGCRWVIVSNFTTIRLYRTTRGEGYAYEVKVADLGNEATIRAFLAVLSRDQLLGTDAGPSPAERLADESKVEERKITEDFYRDYRETRVHLFQALLDHNPAPGDTDGPDYEKQILRHAQTLLDRVLFVCFCEDTALLPDNVLRRAIDSAGAGFVQTSAWAQLKGLFQAIDEGRRDLKINAYNGGLFAADPALDALDVPDAVLADLKTLAAYDFNTDLNVNILGRVFEQSITDLEALHAEIEGGDAPAVSKRKEHGVFYTPEFVTRFVVAQTVGTWLDAQFQTLYAASGLETMPESYTKKREEAERKLWLDYQERLRGITILDLACGSGAFLVAAFDYLHDEYERVNRKLAAFEGGQASLFDLDRQILQENLYGVDLNPESVEITRLSLWLKTARTDKPLNNLDGTIRTGDSIVAPPAGNGPAGEDALHAGFEALPEETRARAFDWQAAFPDVFGPSGRGGFDCVLGNPPYVRQEWIAPLKPYLERAYASYDGKADLFTYFFERGVDLLAPGGKLAYIASNKWLRAGYGAPLRRFLTERAEVETLVDFGHAPVFEGADTFPVIVTVRKPTDDPARDAPDSDGEVQVAVVPRERLADLSLPQFVEEEGFGVPRARFTDEAWSLEPPAVDALMDRLRATGVLLKDYVGDTPSYGVKTGYNAAFLIDGAVRDRLIAEDPRSAEVIKPFVRGSQIKRWRVEWGGEWMVFTRRGIDLDAYPAVKRYLEGFREQLEPKPKGWKGHWKGRKAGSYAWYEIQDTVDYFPLFEKPKLVYTDIAWRPEFALTEEPYYLNNSAYLLPTDDAYLVGVLNSPLLWWFMWREFQHGKDEALRMFSASVEDLPIASPTPDGRAAVEAAVAALTDLAAARAKAVTEVLRWLRVEHGVETPGTKLSDFATLDLDTFLAEVKKRGGHARLSPALVTELSETFSEYVTTLQVQDGQHLQHERRIADAVFEAYGLSEEDIALVWRTAPPRMPLANSTSLDG